MRRSALKLIYPGDPPGSLPSPEQALREPNGLLAVGGDLDPDRLLHAYRRGVFPWYSAGQPILWWCPDPRAVLYPERIRVSRSLARVLRRGALRVTLDAAFAAVVAACAEPRAGQSGTWITPEMQHAYATLHRMGRAHSLEVWHDGQLAGGLYGVAIGQVFFGESMFTRVSDASKVALVALARMGFRLIDCQLPSEHLSRLGAVALPRAEFIRHLDEWCEAPPPLLPTPAP
jgi:leucyl/phenylalanyl-tRNA--protein transferase